MTINIDVIMEGDRVETGLAGVVDDAKPLLKAAFRFTPGEQRRGTNVITRLSRELGQKEGYTIPSDQEIHLLDGLVRGNVLERQYDPQSEITTYTFPIQMVTSRSKDDAHAAGYRL